jgi:hypothetical protein
MMWQSFHRCQVAEARYAPWPAVLTCDKLYIDSIYNRDPGVHNGERASGQEEEGHK